MEFIVSIQNNDMDQDWDNNSGQYNDFLLNEAFFSYLNSNEQQEPTEPQQPTSLNPSDVLNTRIDQQNEIGRGNYLVPTSGKLQEQGLPPQTANLPDLARSPLSTSLYNFDFLDTGDNQQNEFDSGYRSSPSSGQSGGQGYSSNPSDQIMTENSASPVPDSDQSPGDNSKPDVAPKVRRTRRRKVVTPEQAEKRKNGFLLRNREAAKKCRAKRKVEQDVLREKTLRLERDNAHFKLQLEELQAMRMKLQLELLSFQQRIPGVSDEIKSIEVGQPRRPPMFAFHDHQGFVPIMTGSTSQPLSRRTSHSSNFAQQSAIMTPNDQAMSRSGSIAQGTVGHYPEPATPHRMSRTSTQSSRHGLISESPGQNSQMTPKSHPEPIKTQFMRQNSNSSMSSMGTPSSRNSADDSGIGNISPTTQPDSRGSLDEGIVVAAPTPFKGIDPAILEDSPVGYFRERHDSCQGYRPLMDPEEYLQTQNCGLAGMGQGIIQSGDAFYSYR